jgi:outer membrane translocation and assembly module TamA
MTKMTLAVMLLLTAEVSHPIWGPLRGAAFIDAGNAWKDAYDLSFSGINVGVGYGIRLKLPMIKAPLKLDIAYPVVKNQDNVSRKFRIHFNVGFTF